MRQGRNRTGVDYSWLGQFEVEGPFLSLPVVKATWPNQVDRLGDTDDRAVIFKQSFATWLRAYDRQSPERREEYAALARQWVLTVLDDLAEWRDLRLEADDLPDEWEVHSPGQEVRIRPDVALAGRGDEGPAVLVRIVSPTEDLRAPGLDGWSATEIDRMSALLRETGVELGIVTDGRWWAIVWAKHGKPTGSGVVDAVTWGEEQLLRDAFLTLVDQRRFRAKDLEERLPRLLERSELEAEEITEALGTQVRKSVELLVQAFSEARLAAQTNGEPDPLPEQGDEVYQAAVTVMMRVVFLLFAEERGMLPTEQLYWDSYAIRDILDDLKQEAAGGEEHLDESYDAWHRLLAVSAALHGGVNYDEMRMPAYGGSLLDPERYPWLSATDERGLRVAVSDRVMLHVLDSVQYARVSGGESRRISFRDIDVEQIGYIYEGLLGYTAMTVTDDVVLGLVGKDGEEPEIPLGTLEELYDQSTSNRDFAAKLIDWIKEDQPAAGHKTPAGLAKLVDKDVDEAELNRLLTPVAGGDRDLSAQLVSWGNLIRRDLREIPLVVPVGGLILTETPSRKNSGAHYTPRSLAEEVVQHALEPLVYEPGPLQENDRDQWQLKSSAAILDLKVADIAAGSGAFLVAAARFLAARVTEAWTSEDMIPREETSDPSRTEARALREVIARCLYGADINPMAVEMCKLSLWLVSLDPTKPFSFVDDKIFCGNSLLGVTNLDQLRYLHIYPEKKKDDLITELVDIDGKLAEATRIRHELANPVVEHDPVRSRDAKERLLHQAREVTTELRDIADGVIAAGLRLGGKPGNQLENAYNALSWALSDAYPADGSEADRIKLEAILDAGLTPTVETDYERWQPLNWVVEAPDVFGEHGGFDAIIGNPPFLGGVKISGALGGGVREWIANELAGRGGGGRADLVGYFFLQSQALLSRDGCLGLVATNTIAQGDTREVSLDQMVNHGFTITRAVQSKSWPAQAVNLEFAAVWGSVRDVPDNIMRVCDGAEVPAISTLLEPAGRVTAKPVRLRENGSLCFKGYEPYGQGFILEPEEAQRWIDEDPRYAEVLFPYVNGEDLNNRADATGSRWIINFNGRTQEESSSYTLPFQRVAERVRPERAAKAKDVREAPWWLYWRERPGLTAAIADLDTVLALTIVSRTVMPVRVVTGQVLSVALMVFATDSFADQTMLSSSIHQMWAIKYGSGMRGDPRYTPSDGFETLARATPTTRMEGIGRTLEDERGQVILRRDLGLTKLYNLVNDPEIQGDADMDRMREIHVEVDEATMAAYGWDDLELNHGFHTYRQMERWTVSPEARVEILDRLLELNHERARAEGQDVPDQGELF